MSSEGQDQLHYSVPGQASHSRAGQDHWGEVKSPKQELMSIRALGKNKSHLKS